LFLLASRLPSRVQGNAIQAVFLEKLPQRHVGDAESPDPRNEIEQVLAGGLGPGEEKLGDRPEMAGQ
jgi:hypothetical protein